MVWEEPECQRHRQAPGNNQPLRVDRGPVLTRLRRAGLTIELMEAFPVRFHPLQLGMSIGRMCLVRRMGLIVELMEAPMEAFGAFQGGPQRLPERP